MKLWGNVKINRTLTRVVLKPFPTPKDTVINVNRTLTRVVLKLVMVHYRYLRYLIEP